jgi:hypothetical protein
MTSGSLSGTASLASNALLLQGTGSVGFATTASLLEVSSSQQQISSSLLQVSSSQQQISASLLNVVANYATTGSNSFRANQSITGSLVVSSTITAQTLVVQTVTSSIVYSSGSNNFGNQLANTQTFTGSVNITGSLALAGNISGNAITLTGALGGTSATFSSTVTATQFNVSTSGGTTQIYNTGGGHTVITNATANKDMNIQTSGTGGQYFNTAGVDRLIIASTGNVLIGNDANPYIEIANGGSTDVKSGIKWMVGSGRTYYGAIDLATPSASNSYLLFSTMNSGTVAERLRIASTGLATFSGTIKSTQTGQILDASSGTTGYLYQYFKNTTGEMYFGIERSTGGGLMTNSSAYATILSSQSATNLEFGTSGTRRITIASNGKVSISAPTTADAFTVQGASNYWTSILTSGTTTSQAYGLYVKAGTNASDVPFLIQNTSGTDILRILGTGAATFSSTISAGAATFSGKVIGNGFNSFSGDVSIASGVTSTIYTMGDNGLYTVQIIVGGGSLIYSAAAIFYAHSNNGQFVKTIDLYDGANVTLDQSSGAIRITNNGFATLTWNWSILHQRF